jgi:ring-1,2-phenylacetyl-CoA epoxidase subunit PaaC
MSKMEYLLHLADNALIHSHRLSQWCGHGPELEIDMALSNIALDNIGAARSFYQYAANQLADGSTEDTLVYQRGEREFLNVILVEQPNGDFAHTIAKCLFFDIFQKLLYSKLQYSADEQIAAIASKSIKEVTYHLRFSSEWCIRLGDGTEESKQRMQAAVNYLYPYAGEMFLPAEYEQIEPTVDCSKLHKEWKMQLDGFLATAELQAPEDGWHHQGGKQGKHSEHFGFILAEMQYLNRAFPGAEW